MKLYEVQAELYKCFDEETGEITDPEKFEKLEGEMNDKIEGLGCMIKNDSLLIQGLKDEKKRITDRIRTLEARQDSTKDFLAGILQGRKFETPKVKMSYRKSYSVDVVDEAKVPEKYTETVETVNIHKAEILKALKDGEVIDGCSLNEKTNLIIK